MDNQQSMGDLFLEHLISLFESELPKKEFKIMSNAIAANVQNLPENILALEYSQSHDSYYFDIHLTGEQVTRFWINHIEHFEEKNSFFYDFFGSGELYVNPEPGIVIVGVNIARFRKMYLNSFYNSESIFRDYSRCELLTEISYNGVINTKGHISPNSDPDNPLCGWLYKLEDFFHTSSAIKQSQKVSPPVCEYFSLKNENVDIRSKHYQFANLPEFYACCSNRELSSDKTLTPCIFYNMQLPKVNQTKCLKYEPISRKVKSTLVQKYNSQESFSIDLFHYIALDGSHVFTIENTENNQLINSLIYPSTSVYSELYPEVQKIYEDYISCYSTDNLSNKEVESSSTNNDTIKNSYILSLVGSD